MSKVSFIWSDFTRGKWENFHVANTQIQKISREIFIGSLLVRKRAVSENIETNFDGVTPSCEPLQSRCEKEFIRYYSPVTNDETPFQPKPYLCTVDQDRI